MLALDVPYLDGHVIRVAAAPSPPAPMIQMVQVLEQVFVPRGLYSAHPNHQKRLGHPNGGREPLARVLQVSGQLVCLEHCRPPPQKGFGQGDQRSLDPLSI